MCVPLTKEHNYLNFAETRSKKPRDTHCLLRFTLRATDHSKTREAFSPGCGKRKKETSRTIIRATWLRLLPGVHRWSIYQVVSLGS